MYKSESYNNPCYWSCFFLHITRLQTVCSFPTSHLEIHIPDVASLPFIVMMLLHRMLLGYPNLRGLCQLFHLFLFVFPWHEIIISANVSAMTNISPYLFYAAWFQNETHHFHPKLASERRIVVHVVYWSKYLQEKYLQLNFVEVVQKVCSYWTSDANTFAPIHAWSVFPNLS